MSSTFRCLPRLAAEAGPIRTRHAVSHARYRAVCRWQLLYTSRPSTASPIQRAFTGTEGFTIFQEVRLSEGEDTRVNNIVELGEKAKCAPSAAPDRPAAD